MTSMKGLLGLTSAFAMAAAMGMPAPDEPKIGSLPGKRIPKKDWQKRKKLRKAQSQSRKANR